MIKIKYMYTLFKKDSPIKVYVIEFYMYVNNVFLFQYLKKKTKNQKGWFL